MEKTLSTSDKQEAQNIDKHKALIILVTQNKKGTPPQFLL